VNKEMQFMDKYFDTSTKAAKTMTSMGETSRRLS